MIPSLNFSYNYIQFVKAELKLEDRNANDFKLVFKKLNKRIKNKLKINNNNKKYTVIKYNYLIYSY